MINFITIIVYVLITNQLSLGSSLFTLFILDLTFH